MKAVFFEAHGGPEVLQYGDVPDPVAEAGQVVVDVHAASVNGADWRVRQGIYRVGTITVYPLRDAASAHRVSEGRHLRGKLVLAVR